MDQKRISQMLDVLLFPYLDPGLAKMDCFRKRYKAYQAYMEISGNRPADLQRKRDGNKEYQKATSELLKYLEARSRSGIQSYDDILMLCEFYYPFMEVEKNEGIAEDGISECYFNNLSRIASSLLTYRDGIVAIRFWNTDEGDMFHSLDVFDKVQIWNVLCRVMVPDVLIAAFAVECGLSMDALHGQKPYISLADKLLVKTLQKGMAENHLHFNAGFDYEAIWLKAMNVGRLYRQDKEAGDAGKENGGRIWAAAIFRMLSAEFFMDGTGRDNAERSNFVSWIKKNEDAEALAILRALLTGEARGGMSKRADQCEWLYALATSSERNGGRDCLLEGVYQECQEFKVSSEFLLLFHAFEHCKKHPEDGCFKKIFLQYLRIKNEWFQNKQQSGMVPGLRHFQQYFAEAKQAEVSMGGNGELAMDVFRAQARQTYLKKLEIRIAPQIDFHMLSGANGRGDKGYIKEKLCKQLSGVFSLYRRYLLESVMGLKKANEQLDLERQKMQRGKFSYKGELKSVYEENGGGTGGFSIPTLGVVYHLLKAENLDYVSGFSCARAISKTSGANIGHRFFLREAMAEVTETMEELRGEVSFLNEYLVGLDAASDENAMEPWMFAPAYNRMRSRKKTKPIMRMRGENAAQYSAVQNVGFTYHVGEDFRHVASGLRHVDEVMERFHYKAGDRLGHAIVLGTDIGKWVEKHAIAVLPLGEYLDNLLWIWGKSAYDGVTLSIQFERLEREILRRAREIYGNRGGEITVMMLYEAYKKKFLERHREIINRLNERMDRKGEKKEARGCCKHMGCDCEACEGDRHPWDEEKLVYANYCPVFEENRSKVIQYAIKENDVAVFKELQEHLLQKIEQRGIYIETNLTSNVVIGGMEDMRDHPIFRMNVLPSAGHHVMVTVNSDDPVVFNTNVENELSYIYHAMGHGGHAKEDILNWIDKIRQNGMDASFIQREKDPVTLLKEVSGILDDLSRYG